MGPGVCKAALKSVRRMNDSTWTTPTVHCHNVTFRDKFKVGHLWVSIQKSNSLNLLRGVLLIDAIDITAMVKRKTP